MWGGGVRWCWGRALHPVLFLVASFPEVPGTAGDGDAMGMQSATRHCSSACHQLRDLPPFFQASGAPWHCLVHSGLWLCQAGIGIWLRRKFPVPWCCVREQVLPHVARAPKGQPQ